MYLKMTRLAIAITITAGLFLPGQFHSVPSAAAQTVENAWPTVGANPQRTSWTPEEVSGNLQVAWYRPIEAYIPQNVQIIAANGLLFIATARGLYALDAVSGAVAWRYDTELPLGNSPTVANGVVYVGGYDRKLHALDALTGEHLWAFEGAGAGYSVNPLVVEGKVIAGNRDGHLYAIGAHGSPDQGQLLWSFRAGGPIRQTAAYADGVIYFAAGDNHAHALDVDSGALIWRSQKLLGEQFQSYWPVVFEDKVIFSGAQPYRWGQTPGARSVLDPNGNSYAQILAIQVGDLFFDNLQAGAPVGPVVSIQEPWAAGKTVMDASRLTEYYEDNPDNHPHLHKPWRRVYFVLDRADGTEYTFDSDGDGHLEYAPMAYWGTKNGNIYPPLVGQDGLLYQTNLYENNRIRVTGWKIGTPFLTLEGGEGDAPEPQAISSGGNIIYRSVCCDRVGDWFDISQPSSSGHFWTYSHSIAEQAPGYDEMWWGIEYPGNMSRLVGNYGNRNGIYNSHGDQNPIVPYNGRLYVHRSNAIIAYGPGAGPGSLDLLEINPVNDVVQPPAVSLLRAQLEAEVQLMVDAGNLNPAYYNVGQLGPSLFKNTFRDPADTLIALSRTYPHLSPAVQQQVRAYLQDQFTEYFAPTLYGRKGWAEGALRVAMDIPPEVQEDMATIDKGVGSRGWYSLFPPHTLYAMWKYSELFPDEAASIYDIAVDCLTRGRIPVPPPIDLDLVDRVWEHNAYIAGYMGFLELQTLAGMAQIDIELRLQVSNELNRLLNLRSSDFSKDAPWTDPTGSYPLPAKTGYRGNNVARNFMYLVPELADYLHQNALPQVQEAIDEYNWVAPYWFVSRYEAAVDEGALSSPHNYNALFQAKAFILKEPYQELTKYLDVPAFPVGDLFYIQNLVAAIEAYPASCVDLSGDGTINVEDIMLVAAHLGTTQALYDLDGNGVVDGEDLDIIAGCWQQPPANHGAG